MNCSRFETLLSDYLNGTLDLPVRQAAQAHLEACPDCPALVVGVRLLRRELAAFPELRVPQELVERVVNRTSGKPQKTHWWADVLQPAFQPFLTQRYAFATFLMFAFLSLMVNLMGPEFSAFSASSLRPATLVERADWLSSEVYKKWLELNDFKMRVGEEFRLFRQDLYGRLDYHLIGVLFKSYRESIEEQDQKRSDNQSQENDNSQE